MVLLRAFRADNMNLEGFLMSGLTLAITIIQLLCGILLTVVVLFQSGKSAGLSGVEAQPGVFYCSATAAEG